MSNQLATVPARGLATAKGHADQAAKRLANAKSSQATLPDLFHLREKDIPNEGMGGLVGYFTDDKRYAAPMLLHYGVKDGVLVELYTSKTGTLMPSYRQGFSGWLYTMGVTAASSDAQVDTATGCLVEPSEYLQNQLALINEAAGILKLSTPQEAVAKYGLHHPAVMWLVAVSMLNIDGLVDLLAAKRLDIAAFPSSAANVAKEVGAKEGFATFREYVEGVVELSIMFVTRGREAVAELDSPEQQRQQQQVVQQQRQVERLMADVKIEASPDDGAADASARRRTVKPDDKVKLKKEQTTFTEDQLEALSDRDEKKALRLQAALHDAIDKEIAMEAGSSARKDQKQVRKGIEEKVTELMKLADEKARTG